MAQVLFIAAAAMSAISQIQSGNAANNAAKFNAAMEENRAIAAKQQGEAEATRLRERNRRIAGQQEAAYGASGVALDGTPEEVFYDTAISGELDALDAEYQGKLQYDFYRANASLERYSGKQAKRQGYVGAATTIMGSAALGMSKGLLPSFDGRTSGPPGMYNGGTGTNFMTGLRYGGV